MIDVGFFSITLVAFVALSAWIVLELLDVSKKWIVIYTPPLLIIASLTYFTIDGVRGWPSQNMPAEITFLDYRANGKIIYVWGIEKGATKPRTWEIPYTKYQHDQVEQAKQAAKAGRPTVLQRDARHQESDSVGESSLNYQFKLTEPQLPPKDPS